MAQTSYFSPVCMEFAGGNFRGALLEEVTSEPGLTGWVAVWVSGRNTKEKGSWRMRRSRCGHPNLPRQGQKPPQRPGRYKAEVTLWSFKLGNGGLSPERQTYLPVSTEPGELWALLLGGSGPTCPC